MKNTTIWAAIIGIATLLSSCSTAPVTGRRQMNLASETEVAKMSIATFEQMKAQLPISTNAAMIEMLQNVGDRISQQVFWDVPLAEWEFVVFAQPEVNAFAMPGGKVGVYEGLFRVVQTEAELASVVAHEIAHVTARHTHERISQSMVLGAGGQILGIAAAVSGVGSLGNGVYVDATSTIMGLYGMKAGAVANAWDQGKESEADHIGLIYMAKAGYDPNASIAVMERMAEMETGIGATGYTSTHPSSLDRLDALHGLLEEAMVEYEKAKDFYY